MSDVTVHSINSIVSNPNVRQGRPTISGTGITVHNIATAYVYRHESAEEIASGYQISPAEVHAALAYYYEHKTEIDREMDEDDKFAREAKERGLGQRHPPVL